MRRNSKESIKYSFTILYLTNKTFETRIQRRKNTREKEHNYKVNILGKRKKKKKYLNPAEMILHIVT